jgi:DNA-binding transcriptional ArsR family regulator
MPTFAEYASWWLQAKIDGALGTRGGLRPSTAEDYRWRLGYLLRFFGTYPLDAIDGDLCLAFKARILREVNELRALIAAGADLRGPNNQPLRPLGLRSIRHIVDTLAAVLDDAVEDGHPAAQPSALEAHAAVRAEAAPHVPRDGRAGRAARRSSGAGRHLPPTTARRPRPTTRLVAHLHAQGITPTAIAARLGVAKSTVSWHLRRLGVERGHRYAGRRVVCEILGRAGVRVGELCDVRASNAWRAGARIGSGRTSPESNSNLATESASQTPEAPATGRSGACRLSFSHS